ncbi:50S ribosomal protein L4 [Candidatus Kaiserbacteria bacterium]|nr:50S ribosomal protein L4 [Candidatus Kaiserbacteria bacterium]
MESIIYNAQGKKSGTLQLPEKIFGVIWNDSLMHQVVTAMQANARTPVAHTKDRGDVRGGGKKPWRQKGTGRARHGSTRSPIWKGGGVTHGPRNDKDYSKAIPKKMRAKALFMALSRKLKDGEIVFVDTFGFDAPKTAAAAKVLSSLSKIDGFSKLSGKEAKRRNAALIALADPSEATIKSFRNIGSMQVSAVRDMNPVTVLKHKFLIIENPEAAVAIVESRATKARKPAAAKKASK